MARDLTIVPMYACQPRCGNQKHAEAIMRTLREHYDVSFYINRDDSTLRVVLPKDQRSDYKQRLEPGFLAHQPWTCRMVEEIVNLGVIEVENSLAL